MIVCLGWGSLIWDPRDLPVNMKWQTDGPALPVEFARQSADGRITLVIAEETPEIPVLWAALDVKSLDEARRQLASREGIPDALAHRSIGVWSDGCSSPHSETGVIETWARDRQACAVVWTALPPKFLGRAVKPSADQVLKYLSALDGEKRQLAEQYVRRAPAQIRTPCRQLIETQLGWTTTSG